MEDGISHGPAVGRRQYGPLRFRERRHETVQVGVLGLEIGDQRAILVDHARLLQRAGIEKRLVLRLGAAEKFFQTQLSMFPQEWGSRMEVGRRIG